MREPRMTGEFTKAEIIDAVPGLTEAKFDTYRTRGLMPYRAIRRGMYATYPRAALDRYREIVELYAGNMTWRDIRDRLNPEPDPDGDE